MNHLTGSLISLKETLDDKDNADVKFLETKHGLVRHVKTSSVCCVCNERLWAQQIIGHASHLHEAFKVIDPRAYADNILPDYLKVSNVLLECHYDCKKELNNLLSSGRFNKKG